MGEQCIPGGEEEGEGVEWCCRTVLGFVQVVDVGGEGIVDR